jgi:hypothetical protein
MTTGPGNLWQDPGTGGRDPLKDGSVRNVPMKASALSSLIRVNFVNRLPAIRVGWRGVGFRRCS